MTTSARAVRLACLAASLALSVTTVWPAAARMESANEGAAGAVQGPGRGGPPAKPEAPGPKQLIEGTDEDDVLSGGTGDDWIFGKKGSDIIRANAGRDKVDGGEGDDTIEGGAGADIIDAGPGNDTVRGGDGDDTIDGGDEDDLLDGGAGIDDIDGGDGSDVLRGGPGNDILAGGDESDVLNGDAGNDRLSGDDAADTLSGGPGDDVLLGGEGDDSLSGDAGNDRLDGGLGNDRLLGGQGDDTLLGSNGTDTLLGGAGHDILFGGDGPDTLDGGAGHDWLSGGAGTDSISGGDGDDLIIVRAGDVAPGETEVINGGGGTDVLFLNGFSKPVTLAREVRLVDPITGGTYLISNVERVEYTQLAVQADSAATRTLSFILVNPSGEASTGRVIFFGPDGAIVQAAAAGSPAGRDDLTFIVPGHGSRRIDTTLPGPAIAQVFASAPLGVAVRGGTALPGLGAISPTLFLDNAIVPVIERPTDGVGTGILIVNTITASALKLTLHGADGEELDGQVFVGSKDVEIPPYGHRVIFAREAFPSLATLGNFEGTMTIEGGIDRPQQGGPISVVLLERDRSGSLVASPGTPMAVTGAPPIGSMSFPLVTTGGGTTSSIVLVNPARGTTARGTLRFFSESGQPWPVAVNQQTPAATATFEIGGMGSAAFTLPATGPAQRGAVRIEVTQGSVSAVERVSSSAGAVTHVAPSESISNFISPVRRDRSAGLTTSLAVASSGAAVTLRLTLRTAAGADVPGGTTELRLPANGQVSRTLDQLFPAAAADAFDGTLSVTADGGTVDASVTETGGASTAAMGLPVVALP